MNTRGQNIVYAVVMVLLGLVYTAIFMSNGYTFELIDIFYALDFDHYQNPNQYASVADALLSGQLYLDLPVSDDLAAMDNPYDYEARRQFASRDNPVFWDHAFHDGKYYSYFGVIPAIVLFVPYQLITGSWLPTSTAVLVLGLVVTLAACLLVVRIARRYFAKMATTPVVVVAMVLFFGACNLPYLGFVDTFYSIPILGSMACSLFGLWFWMGARRDGRRAKRHVGKHSTRRDDKHKDELSLVRLAAGSFLMAMNLGCRPQFMLACFFAFPLFYDEIFTKRLLFSKRGIKETVAAILPFVIVIVPLLWYNQARFGFFLDFGSTYNLTIFDMNNYVQKPIATLVSLFVLLFEPPHFIASFPFIEVTDMPWTFSTVKANLVEFVVLMIPTLLLMGYLFALLVKQALDERWNGWKRPFTLALVLIVAGVLYVFGVLVYDFVTSGRGGLIGTLVAEPNAGGYFWLCPQVLLFLLLPKLKYDLKENHLWGLCWMMLAASVIVAVFDMRSVGANQRYFSDFAWMVCAVAVICLFAYKQKALRQKVGLSLRAVYVMLGAALVFSVLVGFASLLASGHFYSIAEYNTPLYDMIGSVFG